MYGLWAECPWNRSYLIEGSGTLGTPYHSADRSADRSIDEETGRF